jgi:hypothetical protein
MIALNGDAMGGAAELANRDEIHAAHGWGCERGAAV